MCYSGHTLCSLGGKSPQSYSSEDRNNVNGVSVAIVDARFPGCTDFSHHEPLRMLLRDEKMTFGSIESTLKFESRTLSISVEGIMSFILPLRRLSTKHRAIIGCL